MLVNGPFDGPQPSRRPSRRSRGGDAPDLLGHAHPHRRLRSRCSSASSCYLVFARTSFGTRLDVLGANPRAAVHMGIDVPRLIVVAFLISGALIGLAAAVDILGDLRLHARRLEPGLRPQGRAARVPGPPQRARAHPVRGVLQRALHRRRSTRRARPTCPTDFLLLFIGLILLLFMVVHPVPERQA